MSKKIKFVPHTKGGSVLSERIFVPAYKALPEWWRKTRPTFGSDKVMFNGGISNFTVKKCVPFLDGLSVGYMVILQEDMIVQDGPSPDILSVSWRNSTSVVVTDHNDEQIGGMKVSEVFARHVYKWVNDSEIRTPRGYSTHFFHPTNRYDLPFVTLSGVVDTDSYTQPVQFPFIIQKDFRGVIPAGTPIAQLVPFKRDSWISEHSPFEEEQVAMKRFNFFSSAHSRYRKFHWFKKSYK